MPNNPQSPQQQDYIPRTWPNGQHGDQTILKAELDGYLNPHRLHHRLEPATEGNLTGLAFSGGGIRSASFCLGVLQALAREDYLKRFDYLSTVSGGGYIGSSLSWTLHTPWPEGEWQEDEFQIDKQGPRIEFGVCEADFPFGTRFRNLKADKFSHQVLDDSEQQSTLGPATAEDPQHERVKLQADDFRGAAMLRYLRQHGKYLTPGDGINGLSLLGIILRGMLFNMLVYLPWLVGLFYLLVELELFKETYAELSLLTLLGLAVLGVFAISAPVYALFTRRCRKAEMSFDIQEEDDTPPKSTRCYRLRRGYEKLLPVLLSLTGALLFVAWIPDLIEQLDQLLSSKPEGTETVFIIDNDERSPLLAVLSTLGGILAALGSFSKSGSEEKGAIPAWLLAWIASILLSVGLLMLTFYAGSALAAIELQVIPALVIGGIALVWFLGRWTMINYLSIHRYYRDRLMESFMPNVSKVMADAPGAAQACALADVAPLQRMCPKDRPIGPYHLINTNVVLVESAINKYRGRGGDSFLLSPQFCGSDATGWKRTAEFMGGELTLATAMAISGAAANPNAGVGGEGPTRQSLLSKLMTLLNLRLGVWAMNPNPEHAQTGRLPNFISPGSWPLLFWKKQNEHRPFLELTDGGHFENLGLYELLRRRTKFILACDAAADGEFKFNDLANALEKARTDFGVHFVFPEGLSPLIPVKPKESDKLNPEELAYAESDYICGSYYYPDGFSGTIILIKTTYVHGLPKDLFGYKKNHASYPDESTADQFFDEKQFEAYRVLGFHLTDKMMEACSDLLKAHMPKALAEDT